MIILALRALKIKTVPTNLKEKAEKKRTRMKQIEKEKPNRKQKISTMVIKYKWWLAESKQERGKKWSGRLK